MFGTKMFTQRLEREIHKGVNNLVYLLMVVV